MKGKLGKAIVFCTAALLTACISGCSAGESNVKLIGAFHPETGVYDPEDVIFSDDQAKIKEMHDRYAKSEEESGTYSVFVVIEVAADDKGNISVGNHNMPELVVDGANEYNDIISDARIREKNVSGKYKEQLSDMGVKDADVRTELMAGSGETRRAIFCFCISPADYKDGKTAHLEWDDVSFDFDLKEIQEIGEPSDMIDILAEK